MAADGTIKIDTTVDDRGIKVGARDVEAAAKRMANSVKGLGNKAKIALQKQTDALARMSSQYNQQIQKVDELKKKVQEYADQKIPTDEYRDIAKHIDQTKAKLAALTDRQQKFLDTGGRTKSKTYKAMQYDMEELSNTIKYAEGELEELVASGKAFTLGIDTEAAKKDMAKLAAESEKLQNMNARLNTSYASLKENIRQYSGQSSKAAILTGVLDKASKRMGAAAKKAFGRIVLGAKQAIKSMLGLNKSANKCRMTMGRMLASSILFSTVFRGLSAITGGFKEGLQNLAQYSNETNKNLSMLKSSLTQLKNSFATAFAPILSVVAPILTSFINLISRAVTYVGMFTAALTGKSTYTRATSVQEDYAASLKDTAGAAKDAEKALEGYASPLDDINKMEDKSSSGGGGYTAPAPGDMFEEVPIAGGLADLANQIKDMIQAQDWDGLGGLVAEKLNGVVDKIDNAISWEKVGGKITRFTAGLTAFFNALVRDFDWPALGNTIGSGINTIIYTLDQLITGVDWITLGVSFAAGLMGIFTTVDWPALGKVIGDKFMIAWRTFYGFVTNLDYVQIGLSISQAINAAIHSIDLGMMFGALSTFVVGLLQTLITVIQMTDWHAVGQQVAAALMAIDWLGLAGGLFQAGATLIGGLLQAFGELPLPVQIAAAAVGAFFAVFGTASIIQSVIKSLTGSTGLITAIKAVVSTLGGPLTIAITAAIAIITLLIANWDDVKAVMSKFINWISGIFSQDWTKVFGSMGEVLNGFFSGVRQIVDGIKQIFSGVITFFKGVFSGNLKQALEGIKQIFKGVWEAIVGIVKTPINAIIGLINGMIKGVCSGLNTVIKALNKIKLPDWVPGIGGKGINIKTITAPQIPYLAKGAVIPPNAPFMAMLGDQKSGTNIEAPEGLIRKIIREELGNAGGSGNVEYKFIGQINRRVLFEETVAEAKLRQKQTGRNPFELT